MKQNFNDCLNRVLQDEGGYSNVPGDNGGPTNFGITLADYRKYISASGTAEDVRKMSVAQAKAIYQSKYWDALNCDALAPGVDYTCFDYGVNSGLGRPKKALQRFKSQSGTQLINSINDERTAFLKALAASQEHDQKFLKGWLSRVSRVRQHSLELAKKDNVTGPVVASAGILASLSSYLTNHKIEVAVAAVVAAAIIGLVIHFYKNKGK